MKKKIVGLMVVLTLVCVGCAQADGSEVRRDEGTSVYESLEDDDEPESADSEEVEEDSAEQENKEQTASFTADTVRILAEKKGQLTLEDFAAYVDITEAQDSRRFVKDIEFTYNEEALILRIVAFDGKLLSAFVCDKAFFDEVTLNNEYSYAGRYGDIRMGDIEHILDGTVTIEDYATVELPDGVGFSNIKHWLGTNGGVIFVSQELLGVEQTAENFGIYASLVEDAVQVGGIEIFGSGDFGQSVNILEEYESISIGDVMLGRMKAEVDNGYTWYVAYTNQDDATISIYFYWNVDLFTEEEFLGFTETIAVKENAIY